MSEEQRLQGDNACIKIYSLGLSSTYVYLKYELFAYTYDLVYFSLRHPDSIRRNFLFIHRSISIR